MKKRFLNLLLALVMVAFVVPTWADAATACYHDSRSKYCTVEAVEAKAATCTEAGYQAHFYCTFCEKVMKLSGTTYVKTTKKVIPAGHKYEDGVCTACGDCEDDHVHNTIITAAKPATCVEAGAVNNVYQCNDCGLYFCNGVFKETNDFPENVISATGEHTYSVHVEMVHDATCTEKRVDIKKCATCDATTEVESGGLLDHIVVGYKEIPATCVKDGTTAGRKCRICNTVIYGMETIPATGEHDYAYVSMVHDATCQEPRLNNYKCKNCDATKQDTTGGLLSCNIVDLEAVAPTCIEKGKTAGKMCTTCGSNAACAHCKEITVLQKDVDALGHDHVLVKINKKATCTRDGEGVYDCTRCGYDGVVKVIPKLNHADVEEVLRDATCTRDGWKEVTCSNEGCGKCVTVKIPATGHTEEIIPEVPATCTATGLSEGVKCSVCGEILTPQTVTSMIAHEFTVEVPGKDATCTEDGYTAHTKCAHCDATEGKVEIDTDGHNFEDYICTVCGVRDGSCEHEGASITVQDPTCTAAGKETFSCPTCGYAYEEVLEATGHTAQVHSTAGTCVTQGKTWTACSVCGEITVPETATGYGSHNYVNNQCTHCGEVNPDSICRHTGGVTTNTVAPTCTQSGSVTSVCADCGAVVDTEILPATGHSHNNGVCTACGHRDSDKLTFDFQDVFLTEEK